MLLPRKTHMLGWPRRMRAWAPARTGPGRGALPPRAPRPRWASTIVCGGRPRCWHLQFRCRTSGCGLRRPSGHTQTMPIMRRQDNLPTDHGQSREPTTESQSECPPHYLNSHDAVHFKQLPVERMQGSRTRGHWQHPLALKRSRRLDCGGLARLRGKDVFAQGSRPTFSMSAWAQSISPCRVLHYNACKIYFVDRHS